MAVLSRRTTMVGAFWNVAATALPLATTLLLSVVIGRVLGSTALGVQSLISYVGALVGGVAVIAVTNCATQVMAAAHGAEDDGRLAAVSRLTARAHLIAGLVAAVVIAGIGSMRDHRAAWLLIGLVVFVDALGWSNGSRLVARHGWRAVSPLRLVSQFAGSLLGAVAVLLGGGITGVFAAQLAGSIWLAVVLRRRDRRESAPEAPAAPLVLRPLVTLWLSFLLGALLSQIVDKRVELLFLDAFGTPHEVAVYAVGFSLLTIAVTVPSSLLNAVIPGIASAGAAQGVAALADHLRRAVRLAVLIGFLMTAALATVGPALISTFWGPGFRQAAALLPWMSLSVVFVPLRSLLTSYWAGIGTLAPVLRSGVAGAVVDLGVAAALVPSLGLAGAVAANVAGQLTMCALLVRTTSRALPAVFPSARSWLRSFGLAALVASVTWGTTQALAGEPVRLAVGVLVFTAATVVVGLLAGLLPRSDAGWLASALPAVLHPVLVVVGGIGWARSVRVPTPSA